MKAMVWTKCGSPDFIELREIVTPVPKEREVLIKVKVASINSWQDHAVSTLEVF